jgi:cell division ATPase FtsA
MRGICGIVLDEDRALISFAHLKKSYPTFLQEVEIPISYRNDDFLTCLRQNLEIFDSKIREIEKKFSLRVERIFFELPWGFAAKRVIQDSIPFKGRKRVTRGDISTAKKYLEEKFLDWDDFCLHNIVINYEIEGAFYEAPPLGVWAKKMELCSLLFWIKDKIYKETEDIFANLDRDFGGFIEPSISMFSSVFFKKEKTQGVISVNYGGSCFVVRNEKGFILSREFDFGLKKIIEAISRKFLLSLALAQEVFYRYVSFKELPYFKEITIKKEEGYVSLSTQTLNIFVKDFIKNEIVYLLTEINKLVQAEDFLISFIGRLNSKEGFYAFLKDCVPYSLTAPIRREVVSSSFGCLRYGLSNFLENDYIKNESFAKYVVNIYKDYF